MNEEKVAVAIVVVCFILLLIPIGLSIKLEKEHPCIRYGEAYQEVMYIDAGNGVLVPVFTTNQDCLERQK